LDRRLEKAAIVGRSWSVQRDRRNSGGVGGPAVRVVRGRGGGEGRDALASQPHLVIWVDPCAGLARPHLDEAQRWLLALPVCGVY